MADPSARRPSRGASRILVTDTQERAGLAVARCLHDAGFSVTAAADTPAAPGLWSRLVARRRLVPSPGTDADGFVTAIQRILEAEQHALVLPVTDDALLAISRRREQLAPLVGMGLPSHGAVERALDRERMSGAAARAGLAPPEGETCAGPEEAVTAAAELGLPVLVKPTATVIECDGGTVRRFTRLATTAAEVADAAQQFGRCIVQRRRPGTVVSFAGVAAPGGLLGYAVSRYARTWPAVAGNASFSETFSPPAGLVDAVQAFVDELEWQGTFELELLDSSGQLAAIDFNPRPYGSLSLAVAAGAPLPALWCAWCAGERRAQVAARPGVRYRWEDADLRHALWQMRKGNWPAGIAAVRPQRATVHAYFRLGDPGPIAARALQLLREEAHRMRSP